MMMDRTVVKTGRSMKNFDSTENLYAVSALCAVTVVVATRIGAGVVAAALFGVGITVFFDLDRRTRRHRAQSGRDNLIARRQPLEDDLSLLGQRPQGDCLGLGL